MPTDLATRTDLEKFIELFYQKMLADETLRPIFIDVAKIDLEEHFPILADFWEGILFQNMKYKRNAMEPHLALHEKHPLKAIHFKLWLHYFNESMNELYAGEKAELAKERAKSIALLMEVKVNQMG
jgi:hemoglobin